MPFFDCSDVFAGMCLHHAHHRDGNTTESKLARITGMNTATLTSFNLLLRDSGTDARRSAIFSPGHAGKREHTLVPATSDLLVANTKGVATIVKVEK